ncbi:MAG: hypothetical protein RL393_102, partial [Actinomycetota bacterium]
WTPTAAGNTTLTADFTPSDTTNYSSLTDAGSQVVNVARATQSALSITTISGTYGASLSLNTSGGSSAGAVTYLVNSGSCSVSSSTLSNTAAGDCYVTATMAGGDNYTDVSSSSTKIEIARLTRTISFSTSNYTKSYGDSTFSVVATASAGSGDGGVTYSATGSACSVNESTGIVTISGVGSCSISASVSQGTNHAAASTSTSASITVNKGVPTFSWTNVSKGKNVSFTVTTPTVTNSIAGIFTYSSGSTSVATVSGSSITTLAFGTSILTASFTPTDTSLYESGTTTVTLTVELQCAEGGLCTIGQTGPGGGIVFYVAGSTQSWGRYLEAAPSNWSGGLDSALILAFCLKDSVAQSTVTGFNNNTIGGGKSNTDSFVSTTGCNGGAVHRAKTYAGGSKSDWYLPNGAELAEMWAQRSALSIVDDASLWGYWGSNEVSVEGYMGSLVTANGGIGATNKLEDAKNKTRPIRAITPIVAPSISITSGAISVQRDSSLSSYSLTNAGTSSTYSVSPSLPSGVTLNTSTGLISGSPSATQSATNYTLTATNDAGVSTASFSITVTEIPAPSGGGGGGGGGFIPDEPAPAPVPTPVAPKPTPVVTVPTEPVKDSTGQTVSTTPGENKVIADGKAINFTEEIVNREVIAIKTSSITLETKALTEEKFTKPLQDGKTLNFFPQEFASFTGDGFKASTVVKVWLLSTPRLLGEVPVDSLGKFNAALLISAEIPIGNHTLQINGVSKDNVVVTLALGITIVEKKKITLESIDSVNVEILGFDVKISWLGNSSATKAVLVPSVGEVETFSGIDAAVGLQLKSLTPGTAYSLRLEPMNNPAVDGAKTVAFALPPAKPSGLTSEFLTANSVKINWQSAIGSKEYRVLIVADGRESKIVVTKEPTLTLEVMVGSVYEIKVVSLSAAELASQESAEIKFSVPKPVTAEPENPTPIAPLPETRSKVVKSFSMVVNSKGKVLSRSNPIEEFTRGLKKGSKVTCTIYIADSRYSTTLARSVLSFAVRECESIRKSNKGISTWSKYASFSRAPKSQLVPRKTQYLIDIVRS